MLLRGGGLLGGKLDFLISQFRSSITPPRHAASGSHPAMQPAAKIICCFSSWFLLFQPLGVSKELVKLCIWALQPTPTNRDSVSLCCVCYWSVSLFCGCYCGLYDCVVVVNVVCMLVLWLLLWPVCLCCGCYCGVYACVVVVIVVCVLVLWFLLCFVYLCCRCY